MKIWLVRHGETALNNDADVSQDKIRAWTDVPLNESGRETAQQTGKELLGKGIEVIDSSDLSRARETAVIIGNIIAVRPTFMAGLRPWHLGELAGQSTKDAIPQIRRFVETPDVPVPGGESFNQFKQRAFTTLGDCVQRARGRQLCLVTYHRVERLLKAWLAAGQPIDHNKIDLAVFVSKGEAPGHAEILEIDPLKLSGMRGGDMRRTIGSAIGALRG